MSAPNSETSDQEAARMYRIYKTVKKMVVDRGYVVGDAEIPADLDTFKDRCTENGMVSREKLMFQVQKKDHPTEQLLVTFPTEKPVGVKYLKLWRLFMSLYILIDFQIIDIFRMCTRMVETKVSRGIIIFQGTLTAAANKAIQSLNQGDKSPDKFFYEIDTFSESELLVNITEHQLVPMHIVLTDEEKKAFRLKDTQLPRIQVIDPIARYYGLKRGQVVKIMRPSETSGRYVTYRLCF
ncbi:hypothetical protein G9A89_018721 [Geosiphon pyriformis]|nr:hypothetical protein G9A89_018721 [Geosiphon pyriformis]